MDPTEMGWVRLALAVCADYNMTLEDAYAMALNATTGEDFLNAIEELSLTEPDVMHEDVCAALALMYPK